MQFPVFLILLFCAASHTVDARLAPKHVPTITLDSGVFIGTTTGTVDSFKSIPFAKREFVPRNLLSSSNSFNDGV